MHLKVPVLSQVDEHVTIDLRPGVRVFIVGANGSGKSALVQSFACKHQNELRLISAHRQNWFESNSTNITPASRMRHLQVYRESSVHPHSRWLDQVADVRINQVLFDLTESENTRNQSIAAHVDSKQIDQAEKVSVAQRSIFDRINELLALGRLPFTLNRPDKGQIFAKHNEGGSYSIAQLSDGEKNAFLIATEVLTVDPGIVVVIDEPERHLHRSIIEPFFSALFACRSDCPFIVSTHEIALPVANPEAFVLMLRSCKWSGGIEPVAWDTQMLKLGASMPEDLKLAILGSRKKILFVEGKMNSLDMPLYTTLFPKISVIPKGSCSDVIRAVKGIRKTHEFHHVEAFGLIDRDNLSDKEALQFEKEWIFPLKVHSAEALYYGTDAISSVAETQARSLGCEAIEMERDAIESALGVLRNVVEQMAKRRCQRRVRELILSKVPNWKELPSDETEIKLPSIPSPVRVEIDRMNAFIESDSWDELVARYPLRKSDAFTRIVEVLKCRTRGDYEQMVLTNVQNNEYLAKRLREQVGHLSRALQCETNDTGHE